MLLNALRSPMPPIIPPTGLGSFLVENMAVGGKDAWMTGLSFNSCGVQALASLLVETVSAFVVDVGAVIFLKRVEVPVTGVTLFRRVFFPSLACFLAEAVAVLLSVSVTALLRLCTSSHRETSSICVSSFDSSSCLAAYSCIGLGFRTHKSTPSNN
jgi:hypothetical protein